MNNNEQYTNEALSALKQQQFKSSEHMSQLETELMSKYRSFNSLGFASRHKVLLVWLFAVLTGTSAIAAGAALLKHRLYNIELSLNGEVFSSPSILVEEGQKASITVTGGDDDFEMEILEDGSIIYHGSEDVDVDVKVEEIDVNEDNS